MTNLSVLDRDMYAEAEAARLLRLPQATLHYWLEGGERRGKSYKPVLRVEPRGDRSVTWAEFVEAALLREYRRTHNVPMAELRAFIDLLRDKYDVPYPLAHRRPFVADKQLVLEAQDLSGLDPDFCLVAAVRGQLILTPASAAFVERVSWDGDLAAGWRPHADSRSPVLMSPDVRFGKPAIQGISTEALWEHDEAGESVDEIAEAFDLSATQVRWALAYETSARAACGARRNRPLSASTSTLTSSA
ncbi:MAG: DUF433 domain-containing protein [Actinomycetota bacterium]|nr:DUF433 domain-containing protein [Actinomycetota bacterium]